jgi:hypothetical protein
VVHSSLVLLRLKFDVPIEVMIVTIAESVACHRPVRDRDRP